LHETPLSLGAPKASVSGPAYQPLIMKLLFSTQTSNASHNSTQNSLLSQTNHYSAI
jgi:hypothetical protein